MLFGWQLKKLNKNKSRNCDVHGDNCDIYIQYTFFFCVSAQPENPSVIASEEGSKADGQINTNNVTWPETHLVCLCHPRKKKKKRGTFTKRIFLHIVCSKSYLEKCTNVYDYFFGYVHHVSTFGFVFRSTPLISLFSRPEHPCLSFQMLFGPNGPLSLKAAAICFNQMGFNQI